MPRKESIKPLQSVNRAIKPDRAYLEPDEIARLEESAANLRDRLLIRLLFRLGCRISEALGITVQDIDLAKASVTIQHLKMRMKLSCPHCSARLGKSHTYCPKCGAKVEKVVAEEKEHRRVRTLPIDDGTLGMLRDYISRGGPIFRKGKTLIFDINRHRGWQIVRQCADMSELPDLINPDTGRKRGISPHRLRDAFAVHAMKFDDSGDGLRLLQEHLGHASFNTTAKYRKVAGEELKDWYQKLWQQPDIKTDNGKTN
jgi:integrase/recombinase XerD